jgi:hypothetical protein
MCAKKYDVIMGAQNNNTRLKYSINSRNILYLSSGQVEVTLCPPKYYKNLHVKKNYETLEFYSQINIYNVESIYKNDYNKIKFLRVILNAGQVLVIPPYWFYSIKFLEKHTLAFLNSYTTYINYVSLIPHLTMQLLQIGNVKLNVKKSNYCKNNIKPEGATRDGIKDIEESRKEIMETISEETEECDISDNAISDNAISDNAISDNIINNSNNKT